MILISSYNDALSLLTACLIHKILQTNLGWTLLFIYSIQKPVIPISQTTGLFLVSYMSGPFLVSLVTSSVCVCSILSQVSLVVSYVCFPFMVSLVASSMLVFCS